MKSVIDRLDATHQELLEIVEPLDEAKFARRPSPVEWSIAENVHHLALVENEFYKALEKQITAPTEHPGLLSRLFQAPPWIAGLRLIRVKAPKFVEPLNPPAKPITIDNLNRIRATVKNLGDTHGRARLTEVFVKHPFLGYLDGVKVISLVGYHELRHLKQIKETLKKLS